MFDYYYGNEAEQFSFLRVPKFLFTQETFVSMSCDAKILYSLMLDRMSLSVKNSWLDEENRVYIIFTQDEARQCMNCGNDKCVKIFKELEEIGLISRKNRGMGRPALIYVKNFVHESEEVSDKETEEIKTSENQKSGHLKNRSHEVGKTEVLTSENQKSRVTKNRTNEIGKTDTIKTNNIKTNFSETQSINLAQAHDRPIEGVSAENKSFSEILGVIGYVPERCSYRFASDPPKNEDDFAAFDEESRKTNSCIIPYELGNDEFAMGTALRFLFGYSYYLTDTDKRHIDFANIVIGVLAEMACAEKTKIQDGYVLGRTVIDRLNGLIKTSSLSDCIWSFEEKWETIVAETKIKNPRSYMKSTLLNWLLDYKFEDFCYAF